MSFSDNSSDSGPAFTECAVSSSDSDSDPNSDCEEKKDTSDCDSGSDSDYALEISYQEDPLVTGPFYEAWAEYRQRFNKQEEKALQERRLAQRELKKRPRIHSRITEADHVTKNRKRDTDFEVRRCAAVAAATSTLILAFENTTSNLN